MAERIRLGVSTCLLGEQVRFDGGHKRDRFVTDVLGRYVDFVPVCPEHELGLGVPRESMHLEGDPAAPRLVTTRTHRDLTEPMQAWCRRRVRELEGEELCGYIFKANSPSSGMERVKVYKPKGPATRKGVGLFARAFMDHFPLIPVEEEGRLNDARLRENFIEMIFALKRYRDLLRQRRSRGGLISFHTRHKLLLMAHSEQHYRALGRLVAKAKQLKPGELFTRYEEGFVAALRVLPTARKHSNVLQHMAGYFKQQLSADEKQELGEVIDQYRAGLLPLVVPITMLKHYVRKFQQPYLAEQVYLSPHPIELMLRNHV